MHINGGRGFIPLLKPVLDLAKQWDMDIAQLLESYLNSIRADDISDMNFPQAAVLLQNSVNIYGKRVDFLFNVTTQLLELLRKKPNERKGGEEANPVNKGKKKTVVFDNEELLSLDDICSEKNINCKVKENKTKKKSIVLNAGIKIKPKENTCCTVYNYRDEVMGRKDDFRLHWRISSDGTLNEEFSSENESILEKQDRCNETILSVRKDDDDDEGPHDASLAINGHSTSDEVEDELPEFEHQPSEELVEKNPRINRPEENIMNADEVEGMLWKPVAKNAEIVEHPSKKKNILKIPEEVQEARKENKRKWAEFKMILNNYNLIDFLVKDRYKEQKCFNYDDDLLPLQAKEQRLKKQLILKRRRYFNELLAREAKHDLRDDFPGFHDMEQDGKDGFAGFDDEDDDDDDNREDCVISTEVEVPLPDNALFNQNVEDNLLEDSYEDEARRALQQYRMKKQVDHNRMTALAKRVAAWHETILPKLKAAEERSHFDIHEYGSRILEKFPKSHGKNTLPFSEVVTDEPPEEVARFFLSSLMLANTCNVEISKSDPEELSVDCMNLTLLSSVRHYEELDDNMRAASKDI